MRTSLFSKLALALLLIALIPFAVVGTAGYQNLMTMVKVANETHEQIAATSVERSSEFLNQELRTRLGVLAADAATELHLELSRVEADTGTLASYAEYLYNYPDSFTRYAHPRKYYLAENGAVYVRPDSQKSWVIISNLETQKAGFTEELQREVHLSEYLDEMFASLGRQDPYAGQIYINSASQLSRGMRFENGQPVLVDAQKTFDPDIDITSYEFYYLADTEHNSSREAVWTSMYWDPAGMGWTISCVAPVYRQLPGGQADELVAVVGIDIPLESLTERLQAIRINETGFAFLITKDGQAIAFPDKGAVFFDFRDPLAEAGTEGEPMPLFLTDLSDGAFRSIIQRMRLGRQGVTTYHAQLTSDSDNSLDRYIAYHPVEVSGWSVGIVTAVQEVTAPITQMRAEMTAQQQEAVDRLREVALLTTRTLLVTMGFTIIAIMIVSLGLARSITSPIRTISQAAERMAAGDYSHPIAIRGGSDEVASLAESFERMRQAVKTRQSELLASEARFRDMAELLPDPLFETDAGLALTYVNRAFWHTFGYTVDDVAAGLNFDQLTDEKANEDIQRALDRMSAGETVQRVTFQARGNNRGTFPCEMTLTFRRSADGAVIGFRGIARDITNSRRSEELARIQRDLGIALSASQGWDETFGLCVQAAQEASGLECACVYIVEQASGSMRLVYHTGVTDQFVSAKTELPRDDYLSQIVLQGVPLHTNLDDLPADETFTAERLKAICILPIHHEGQVIASLLVASRLFADVPETARMALEAITTMIGNAVTRVETQEALRLSEANYRELVQSAQQHHFAPGRLGTCYVRQRLRSTLFRFLGRGAGRARYHR